LIVKIFKLNKYVSYNYNYYKIFSNYCTYLINSSHINAIRKKNYGCNSERRGPNVIGKGLLQPLADGLKLLIKEFLLPLKSNKFLFILAPILFLTISFATWSVLPFEFHVVSSPNQGILCFLAFSSLSVYGILLGGGLRIQDMLFLVLYEVLVKCYLMN
jgi:NADH-quinone oxidoreductase subunit H